MADKVKETAELAEIHKGDVQGMDDYVVSKVSIILDPSSPIRYKGFAFLPEAYGPVMAVELLPGATPRSRRKPCSAASPVSG